MDIHSSGHTIFSLPHMEGITLGAGEEVDEVAGEASGMVAPFINTHVMPFYRMFTYIYFLLIEKSICDHRNISSFHVFVYFQLEISSLFW